MKGGTGDMDHFSAVYMRFLSGDRQALTEIIEAYREGLTYFLLTFTGDPLAAEEAVQETFVRLYVKKPDFSGKAAFKTWLYGVGRNAAREMRRKTERNQSTEETIPDPAPDPESAYFAEEEKKLLHRAMARLDEPYRQALWLHYFEEMRTKEIAVILHKSPGAVDALLYRARAALKEELKKEGFEDEIVR